MYLDSIIQNYLYNINFECTKEQELLQITQREMPMYPERPICDWYDTLTKCNLKKKGKCPSIHDKELLCLCQKNCGLVLHRQLHIKYLSDKGFCVHSRLEPSRDILMLSRKHYHPEKLIQRRQFWEKAFKTIGLIQDEFPLLDLPIQSMYINFGLWSTQTKYSKKILSPKVHGLVHFLLSSDAILCCSQTKLSIMKGRLEYPLMDRFDYADELNKKKKIDELANKYNTTYVEKIWL